MISASTISILVSVTVFLIALVVMIIVTGANIASAQHKDDKISLHHWEESVYDALFHSSADTPDPSAKIAKIALLDVKKYKHQCRIARIEARPKQIIIDRFLGAGAIVVGGLLTIVTMHPAFVVFALLVAAPLILWPAYRAKDKVDRKKRMIEDELPRFLDMLHTALVIGMPIEAAIEMTCQNLKSTILAKELSATMAEVTVGAGGWQDALECMACDYSVDSLSDFVLDLVTAYRNGTPITESVRRKCKEIKQSNLLTKKEHAGKLTNTILFPILIFKILPLLLLLCIPMIMQLNQAGFGL